ncbi:hypothetical protein GGF39_001990, partial [Coemansia sp. RSA 1721]
QYDDSSSSSSSSSNSTSVRDSGTYSVSMASIASSICHTGSSGENYGKIMFCTNIDLITSLGFSKYVRSLHICLDETRFIEPFVELMPALFGFGVHSWTNVRYLWLNLYQSILEDSMDLDAAIDSGKKTVISRMGKMIVEEMPHVNMLRFDSDGEPAELGNEIKTSLLDNYAHNLKYYSTGYPVAHNFRRFSSEMTHLEIRINSESTPLLPRINAGCLQKLVLDDVPSYFNWQCFEPETSSQLHHAPGLIRFADLQVFELYFSGMLEETHLQRISTMDTDAAVTHAAAAAAAAAQYRVEFPKLHTLSVTNYPPDAAMSLVAEYPEHMRQLTLRFSFIPPSVFIRSNIKQVTSLDITLYYAQLDHPESFYALTNHLFGPSVEIEKNATLLMSYSEFQMHLRSVHWPNLTIIRLMSQVEYATMEQLVRKMPRLEKLVIYELLFDQQQTLEISSSESCAGHLVCTPWNTAAVKYLDILSLAYVSRPDVVKSCIRRFLLHVPSLRSLHINGCEAIGLNELVDLVKPQYPHLQKLVLSG